jgi:hypothetical protein
MRGAVQRVYSVSQSVALRSLSVSFCAPVSRWRQGQALRVLRNLDTAGRGRSIERAGSEGMPFLPHQGNGNAEASDHKLPLTKCVWSLNCSLWETGTGLFYLDFVFVGGFGLRNKTRFSEGRFLIVHPYSSANAQALVRASSSGSPGGKTSS